jgi:hypothetical protein
MKKRVFIIGSILAIFLIAGTALSAGLDYDIPWWTSEGGGSSAGGNYALTGVIGQPDAQRLSGGDFTLVGGFLGIKRSPQNKIYLPLVRR